MATLSTRTAKLAATTALCSLIGLSGIKDDGSNGYHSLLITQANSKISTLQDVLKCDKMLTFGNGDPNSTSGFAIPGYYVWALNNKTPEECFKRVTSSNHEGNAMAVANAKVDIATRAD